MVEHVGPDGVGNDVVGEVAQGNGYLPCLAIAENGKGEANTGLLVLLEPPLTFSFVAKEAFFYQLYHAAEHNAWVWIVAAMAVLTAVCNVAIFVRFLTTFTAKPEDQPNLGHTPEPGFWGACIWWPAAFLVFWQFVGGIFTPWFGSFVHAFETHALYFEHLPTVIHAVTHPGIPLAMSGVAIAIGITLGLSSWLRTRQP